MTFGFILTRHVNSAQTNKYWIRSVSLINSIYPDTPIVIIDDNSDPKYLTREIETTLKNLTVIQSEYPGRGELLPFIYYLRHRWFNAAVIMHDGVFVHKKIDFNICRPGTPRVFPLWHFPYSTDAGQEDLPRVFKLTRHLKNNVMLQKRLANPVIPVGMNMGVVKNPQLFNLCFGVQAYIQLSFLDIIENKYGITNLIPHVRCRNDRCALERIFGCIFHTEEPNLLANRPSVFGHILKHKRAYKYTFHEYMRDVVNKQIPSYFVKVWSGR